MRNESEFFLVATISVCLLADCSFGPNNEYLTLIPPPDTPFATPTESAVNTAYLDAPTVAVYHGYACAESNQEEEDTENYLRLRQELALPSWATAATVLLNGWQVQYLKDDHEVTGFATSIYAISAAGNPLTWEAAGILSDHNFDDGYRWCYRYTVIAWNPALLSATVDDRDRDHMMKNGEVDNTTALKTLPGLLSTEMLPTRTPVAVLPRGLGMSFSTGDHHLFNVAYNLDYSERFIENGKKYSACLTQPNDAIDCGPAAPVLPLQANYAEGYVSWESKTILKDNDLRYDYINGELVSALGGADVGVIQPPFTVLPLEDTGSNCPEPSRTLTSEVVTESVPFEYAVPMLTGWELAYGCSDEHVTEMGVWIDRFSYTRPSGGAGGTLRHTVSTILRDKDSKPFHTSRFRAHILGFKRVAGLPGAPAGTVPTSTAPAKPAPAKP